MPSETKGATGLAGRYATALYDLAEADRKLDEVAADLRRLDEMIRGSEDLTRLIRSPVIPRGDQAKAMAAVLDKAGIGDLTARFVGLVARKRRLFALPDMIAAYLGILAERRGEITARVVSAKKLTDRQMRAVEASLRRAVGAKVAIDARVDDGLLGGLVVRVGSRMVDSSLRTKLQHLRLAMMGSR